MDSMSMTPVCFSSLEADDLENLSDPDDPDDEESQNQDEVQASDDLDDAALRDQLLRPRFENWLGAISKPTNQACTNLLLEMFNHLSVTSVGLEVISSERHSSVDFEIYGMQGCYRQCSQADPLSATWETKDGEFQLKPNVEAELVLDGETLLSCAHFALDGNGSEQKKDSQSFTSQSRRFINKERFSESFGSETLSCLGGIAVLLQFLGVICIDLEAPCYTEVLPFGLGPDILKVMSNSLDSRTSSPLRYPPRSPQGSAPSRSRGTAAKMLSPGKAAKSESPVVQQQVEIQSSNIHVVETSLEIHENGAYPSANATQTSLRAPPAPLPPKGQGTEHPPAPPSRPTTRSTSRGSGRPRVGAKATAETNNRQQTVENVSPKARQSSLNRKAVSQNATT